MIVPEFIKPGDTIGVTALSRAMEQDNEKARFASGKAQLEARGYKVVFTENVFNNNDRFGRSSSAEEKAKEFNALIADPSVKAIYSAGGGDFLAEMLPFVDLELFKKNPKWVQGFSDNTSILYYLATKGGVVTAYGANFGDYGMENWDDSVKANLGIFEGKIKTQKSFEYFQNGFGHHETGLEGYEANGKVEWKNICPGKDGNLESLSFEGRLIGGCMDVVMNIAGTPYDGTKEFIEKYKDEGIIWFLESFDLGFEQMMESLWKMKEMGWFEGCRGVCFGRPLFYAAESFDGTPLPAYEDVIHERLDELGIPVIMDADIGHKGPQFVMLMGAKARIESAGGKGSCTYTI